MQDSTPIIEAFESTALAPSIHPPGITLCFLSTLLEEFGDEWGNKWMFHYRWAREVDQDVVSSRLAKEMVGTEGPPEMAAQMSAGIKARMSGRGFAVGSNELTAPLIEEDFKAALAVLEAHLAAPRAFLFGGAPCFADFGLAAQIHQARIDPTAGAIVMQLAPRVAAWAEGMLDPKAVGPFETWSSLEPTLEPLLGTSVRTFLEWTAANSDAVGAGANELTITLPNGKVWTQAVGGPQKYHRKSLAVLRAKFASLPADGSAELHSVLTRCSCIIPLSAPLAPLANAKL